MRGEQCGSEDPTAVDPYAYGSFVPLFEHIKSVPGLTHSHHRLYGVLAAFRGRGQEAACNPRLSAICGRYGTTDERSVRRLLSDLERARVIGIDRSGNAQGKPSSYSFLLHPGMLEKARGAGAPGGQAHPGPGGDVDPGPAGQERPGPAGQNTADLKNLVKNLLEEPLEKGAPPRASAPPAAATGEPAERGPQTVNALPVDPRMFEVGIYLQTFRDTFHEVARELGFRSPPDPDHGQLRAGARRAGVLARDEKRGFVECARELARAALEAQLATGKSAGLALRDVEPGKAPITQSARTVRLQPTRGTTHEDFASEPPMAEQLAKAREHRARRAANGP